jgi:hypothetical protein
VNCVVECGVHSGGEVAQGRQCFDVAVRDSSGVSPHDAAGERVELAVLHRASLTAVTPGGVALS